MAKYMRAKRRRRSGPVTISYLPGFGPATKFPFKATINGKPVTVWPDRIEREEEP